MSIFPSTDIVSDVARAADPRRLHAAMKRFDDAAAGGAAHGRAVASASRDGTTSFSAALSASRAARSAARAESTASTHGPEPDAAQKFEAFILQSWLEILLPKADEASFGAGEAGSVWRSMMAEQLGAQIARAGGVGIRKLLDFGGANPDSTSAA